jgi:hypothetical protein
MPLNFVNTKNWGGHGIQQATSIGERAPPLKTKPFGRRWLRRS